MNEKLNLPWDTFIQHGRDMLKDLFETEKFSDVTLISDDQHQFKTHKFILSASSLVFEKIFSISQNNSFIYLRGVKHEELDSILQYIYLGEATFYEERVNDFFKIAKDLKLKEIGDNEIQDEVSEKEGPADVLKEVPPFNDDEAKEDPIVLKDDKIKVEPPLLRYDEKDNAIAVDKENVKWPEKENQREIILDDESLYFCDLCEKKFITKRGLSLHQDTIHQNIKYPCEECDYQATQPVNLRTHVKTKHLEVKYPCPSAECNYKTKFKYYLKDHLKKKHNRTH